MRVERTAAAGYLITLTSEQGADLRRLLTELIIPPTSACFDCPIDGGGTPWLSHDMDELRGLL